MKWIWRVKKWKLSGTIDWDVLTPSSHGQVEFHDTTIVEPDRLNPLGGATILLTRESDIVCFYEATIYSELHYTFTDTSDAFFDSGPDFVIGGTNIAADAENTMIHNAGLFYPICGFYCLIGGSNDDEGYGFEVSTADLDTGTYVDVGKITVDGNEIRVYVTSFSDSGIDTGSVVVDLIVAPSEYWPYANSNGDPVYNTSTGATLTDPLG